MNKHVLIIEGDEEFRGAVALHMEDQGFRVSVAGRAQDALLTFARLDIDLVLLNPRLPDHDGQAVLDFIRGRSPVPVIVLADRGDNVGRLGSDFDGADALLGKAAGPRRVVLQVRDMMQPADSVSSAA